MIAKHAKNNQTTAKAPPDMGDYIVLIALNCGLPCKNGYRDFDALRKWYPHKVFLCSYTK